MEALKQKLEAFQRSRLGQFVKKLQDDQATNLAALLAWGTLSTLLPLLLGVLGLTGLVLRDPRHLDQIYTTLLVLVPEQAKEPLGQALDSVRHVSAAGAGLIGLVLLLFNGSRFFSNMASVFDHAYHVEGRNLVMQQIVALAMLVSTTALLIVSTTALSVGSLLGSLPIALPVGPVLGRAVSWSVSILSAILLFLLLYRVLPNVSQSWRDVLPGTLVSTVLFFAILLLFPVYVALFPPNQAYALFGVFLVFTFWLYLLGLVFVIGAEVNAFLQQPARSTALAETTAAPAAAGAC